MNNKELLKLMMQDLMKIYIPNPGMIEQMAINNLNQRVEAMSELNCQVAVETLRRRLFK